MHSTRGGRKMTCLEFQGLMIRYINGELSYKEKEQFIEHVSTCEECKDELEIYYIILNSMKQMDEDGQLSDDFHGDFLNQLTDTQRELILRKKGKIRRRVAFPMMVGATMVATGLNLPTDATISPEAGIPQEASMLQEGVMAASEEPVPKMLKKSTFEMKFRFSDEERHRMYEANITEQTLLDILENME